MQDYKKLKIWEKGHQLALRIYSITKKFPKEEMYGLTNQMRRTAYSIPSNIAEGCGRGSDAELKHFLNNALGSANELEYFLTLSKDLLYYNENMNSKILPQTTELIKMINVFIKKIKADS